jgi:hypothetical protein
MVITAKFDSKCPCCGLAIQVGSKVNWSRGVKASHASCAPSTTPSAVAPSSGRRGSYARRSYSGERYVKTGSCWECGAYGPLTQDGECGHC